MSNFPNDQFRRAVQLHREGNLGGAVALYRNHLTDNPTDATAWLMLGMCFTSLGRFEEAAEPLRHADRMNPDLPDVKTALANALYRTGRVAEAEVAARAAVSRDESDATAHNMLGIVLRRLDRLDQAERELRKSIELDPKNAEAIHNLSDLVRLSGRMAEAVALLERAVAIRPDFAAAQWNLAGMYMTLGDYPRAFERFEWRWLATDLRKQRRSFSQPLWDGKPLGGKSILVQFEQGFGDLIQFARFIPQLSQRGGGRVIVEAPASLIELIRSVEGVTEVVPHPTQSTAFDCHVPIMSLPRLLGISLENLPAQVPYLAPPAAKVARWRDIVPTAGFRVGLVWRGNPEHDRDRERSIDPALLAPLLAMQGDGITFVSLQVPRDPLAANLAVFDLSGQIRDFSDTAAIIENLDLVIGADTSVIHLAGALARPVWTMVTHWPDWRWMLLREDSPWYPTMRMFRQHTPGDWPEVIARVGDALRQFSQAER
ncbi:MAG: tetratricopeptide repeat protein [Tepidisphaeraceae bacterium]